jgi:hypothetical protein
VRLHGSEPRAGHVHLVVLLLEKVLEVLNLQSGQQVPCRGSLYAQWSPQIELELILFHAITLAVLAEMCHQLTNH